MTQSGLLTSAVANFERAKELIADEFSADILEKLRGPKERIALKLSPQLYKVLLHNDDYTTMEFVVMVLMDIFHLSEPDASFWLHFQVFFLSLLPVEDQL